MEILYPFITYRRFGGEYRLQIMEFFSFSGGQSSPGNGVRRFTIFPFYFQQRAPDTNLNYTAVVPFYGDLKNRLFRDEIKFVMYPLYSETRKRDVVTDNYLYPFFDVRRGDHLTGWQFWPVAGVEHKTPTLRTNSLDEVETVGGYDKYFAAWPFYLKSRAGLGTTNEQASMTVTPFYHHSQSATRDETYYGWPLGYNVVEDREKKYVEHDFAWPLFVVARGERRVTRVFPFYSRAGNTNLESDFISGRFTNSTGWNPARWSGGGPAFCFSSTPTRLKQTPNRAPGFVGRIFGRSTPFTGILRATSGGRLSPFWSRFFPTTAA